MPRKESEAGQNENEKQFRRLFKQMPDAVIILDREGTFLDVSDEAEKISGCKSEELIGKSLFMTRFLDIKAKAVVIRKLTLHFSGEKIPPFEIEMHGKDGRAIPLEVNQQIIDYMGKKADMIVIRDISERKKAEKDLEESEERYRVQFEQALDAIFIADAETGILVDCNRAATELVERDRSEIIGQHQRILHPPEKTAGKFSETFRKHMGGTEGKILESQIITKRGELKDVGIRANLVELKGKKFLVGTFRDITDSKKVEESIKEKTEEMERFSKLSVGRELKMVELKKRIGELESLLKKHGIGPEEKIERGNE
jgi:PAS domain S-box-containing protein